MHWGLFEPVSARDHVFRIFITKIVYYSKEIQLGSTRLLGFILFQFPSDHSINLVLIYCVSSRQVTVLGEPWRSCCSPCLWFQHLLVSLLGLWAQISWSCRFVPRGSRNYCSWNLEQANSPPFDMARISTRQIVRGTVTLQNVMLMGVTWIFSLVMDQVMDRENILIASVAGILTFHGNVTSVFGKTSKLGVIRFWLDPWSLPWWLWIFRRSNSVAGDEKCDNCGIMGDAMLEAVVCHRWTYTFVSQEQEYGSPTVCSRRKFFCNDQKMISKICHIFEHARDVYSCVILVSSGEAWHIMPKSGGKQNVVV